MYVYILTFDSLLDMTLIQGHPKTVNMYPTVKAINNRYVKYHLYKDVFLTSPYSISVGLVNLQGALVEVTWRLFSSG